MKFKQSASKKIFDIYTILKKISTFKHIKWEVIVVDKKKAIWL